MMRTIIIRALRSQPSWLRLPLRAGVILGLLATAFLAGKMLGHLHFGNAGAASVVRATFGVGTSTIHDVSQPENSRGTRATRHENESRLRAAAPNSAITPDARGAGGAATGKLRVRAVTGVHRSQTGEGGRVTFLTTEDFEDASGRHVPAGSRVEGVIAPKAAPGDQAAEWLIEIHSLHVGNQAFRLHALPQGWLSASQRTPTAASPQSNRQPQHRKGSASMNPLQQIPHFVSGSALLKDKTRNGGDAATLLPEGSPAPAGAGDLPVKAGDLVLPRETVLEFQLLGLPTIPLERPEAEAPAQREKGTPPAPPVMRPSDTLPGGTPHSPRAMSRPRTSRA